MQNFIDISIPKLIESCISEMKLICNITAITDNLNGFYTITVDKIGFLQNNWVVSILNTPNFTGEFIVSNVTSNSFDITKKKGITITTFGTCQNITPQFYFEKWNGAKVEILQQAIDYVSSAKKFPCCLLLLDIPISLENSFVNVPNVTIYFFENTESNKNARWRDLNTMPKLRYLYQSFLNILSKNNKVVGNFTHEMTELFYEDKPNKLGSIVDAVEIKIKNLKLINSNSINC